MSQNIIKRIDDMGSRIDELETSIADLMQQVSPQLFCTFDDILASTIQAAPSGGEDQ